MKTIALILALVIITGCTRTTYVPYYRKDSTADAFRIIGHCEAGSTTVVIRDQDIPLDCKTVLRKVGDHIPLTHH